MKQKVFGKVFVQMRVALKYEIKTNCQQVGYILFHFVGRRRHQGMITIKLYAQRGKYFIEESIDYCDDYLLKS